MDYELSIWWNGKPVLQGQSTAVMAYKAIRGMFGAFVEITNSEGNVDLEAFARMSLHDVMTGTFDDETAVKACTGRVSWTLTRVAKTH